MYMLLSNYKLEFNKNIIQQIYNKSSLTEATNYAYKKLKKICNLRNWNNTFSCSLTLEMMI